MARNLSLVSGLPTNQFLISCSMQKLKGRLGIIYHMNDRGGGAFGIRWTFGCAKVIFYLGSYTQLLMHPDLLCLYVQ